MINIIKELKGIKELIANLPECEDPNDEKKVKHHQAQKDQLLQRINKRCDRLINQQKLRDKMGSTKMLSEE